MCRASQNCFKKLNKVAKNHIKRFTIVIMKVARISNTYRQNFRSEGVSKEIVNPFLYTANENYKPKYMLKEHKYSYLAGVLAIITAAACLKKFTGRNSIPKDVVELADKTLGLNKLKSCGRTVTQLKENILYPMKCLQLGDKNILREDFKTGLIIADESPAKARQVVSALLEHAESIGIHCEKLAFPQKKNRVKEVHKAINAALKYHQETGKCVIVSIGDLAQMSNLKVCKTEYCSNIEKRLAEMPKGVLWTAWTTASDNLPYFYNNLPTLSVRLID